jgi:xanthine dehydrogenase accessory factor
MRHGGSHVCSATAENPDTLCDEVELLSYPLHHSLRHLLDDWRAAPRPAVAALVLATRGSSYRRAGALALIDSHGLASGCISGGCLEADLVAAAQASLGSGEMRRVSYDTSSDEDRVFGSQSGCRGQIDILLWPSLDPEQHPLLDALVAADDAHLALWIETARQVPRLQTGMIPEDPGSWLRMAPPPRVLLLGGGPEAPPLLTLARTLGWRVDVVEHRARYLAGSRLISADHCIEARPGTALASLDLKRYDAALCATHLFDEDRICLQQLANAPLPFIGILGPASRREELLAELGPDSGASLRGRLEGPVGVMLGSHGPEALALSIVARLTQVFARG